MKPAFQGWSDSQRLVEPVPDGWRPWISVLMSHSQPWMLSSETAIVRVGVVVASPFALLWAGAISIREEGECSGGGGEQKRVRRLQALELLELPEYAERL